MREAGMICPIDLLPSKDLGIECYKLIDILCEEKVQVLYIEHLSHRGFSLSGDEKYINVDKLCEYGFLTPDDIDAYSESLDKDLYLRLAYDNFLIDYSSYKKEYMKFLKQGIWLDAYASLFDDADYHRFLQFIFKKQYSDFKQYANDKNIKVMASVSEADDEDVKRRCLNLCDLVIDLDVKIINLIDYVKEEIELQPQDILVTSDYFSNQTLANLMACGDQTLVKVASQVVKINDLDNDYQNFIHYALNSPAELVLVNMLDYLEVDHIDSALFFKVLDKKRFKLRNLIDSSKRRKQY